jgi:hypothetical protein
VEVHSTVLPDGRVGLLLANLNPSGTSTVNITVNGISVANTGTTWRYGVTQTTPLETPMASGLGNSFSTTVPPRSILAILIDAALPGDFNNDGIVDAGDYVVLRQGLGTIYSQTDYDAWLANFGQSAGNGASAAVPEPQTALLVLAAAALGCLCPRRIAAACRTR